MLSEIDGIGGLDSSGLRGGNPRQGATNRGPFYPYDNPDSEKATGVQSKEGEPLHHFLVPRNVDPDDERWGSEIEEAAGTPMNFGMSSRSSRGNDIPGAQTGWSHPPTHPWDADEESDEVEAFGKDVVEDLDPELPPTEFDFADNPAAKIDDDDGEIDTEIFSATDVIHGDIFGGDPIEVELVVKKPAGLDLVDLAVAQLFSGLLPNESAWVSLENFSD